MRVAVLTAILATCCVSAIAQSVPQAAAAASDAKAEARGRVVPAERLSSRKMNNDELRMLLKAQTEAIKDLSDRLDQMDKRLMQLEKRER